MVESQDSLYNMDSQEFNLASIPTNELLSSPDFMAAESILELSPSEFNRGFQSDQQLKFGDEINYQMEVYHQEGIGQYSIIPQLPLHFSQLPVSDNFDTDWCFNMDLRSETASKSSWMFSNKLNKAFVKIGQPLNVYPEYNVVDPNQEIFIRAMIVYTSSNEAADPVKKCPNHRDQSTRDGLRNSEHILRCLVEGTEYLGIENGKTFQEKLSLRIPMQSVTTGEPLKLVFTCQNSCSGGMNRRLTSIIFTLENAMYEILGRRVLHFKVCSCPKRDREKDEEGTKPLPKKRKMDQAPSTSKKVAIPVIVKQEPEPTEQSLSSVPSDLQSVNSSELLELKKEPQNCDVHLTMPSPELKKQLLNLAHDLVAGQMLRTGDASLKPYLNDISKQIDDN